VSKQQDLRPRNIYVKTRIIMRFTETGCNYLTIQSHDDDDDDDDDIFRYFTGEQNIFKLILAFIPRISFVLNVFFNIWFNTHTYKLI
jgi:hypothetical protein